MSEATPFLRFPYCLLFGSLKALGKARESNATIMHIPNEVLLLILNYLHNVDRCSFALACKHFARMAVLNPHRMEDSETGFRTRYDFMTLLSRAWLPPNLHFCFRCNHLARIDNHVRDSWYADDDGDNANSKDMTMQMCPRPAVALNGTPNTNDNNTQMSKGEWCHWKLRVGNEKRITAWCPKCVTGNLNAMAPVPRPRPKPARPRLIPTLNANSRAVQL